VGFTPRYASPEQWDPARGATGPRSDLFSIGLVLWEACMLRPALAGDTVSHVMASALSVGRVPRLRPELAPLGPVLVRATHPDPAHRFANARELRDAVSAALRSEPRGARWPIVVAIAIAVAAALGLGALVLALRREPTTPQAGATDASVAVTPAAAARASALPIASAVPVATKAPATPPSIAPAAASANARHLAVSSAIVGESQLQGTNAVAVVHQNAPQLARCFSAHAADESRAVRFHAALDAKGAASVTITEIAHDGLPVPAAQAEALGRCVQTDVAQWPWPKPSYSDGPDAGAARISIVTNWFWTTQR
jgi:hypothetical protein